MLEKGYLFNQKLIHEKYKNMVLQTEELFLIIIFKNSKEEQ